MNHTAKSNFDKVDATNSKKGPRWLCQCSEIYSVNQIAARCEVCGSRFLKADEMIQFLGNYYHLLE